MRFSLAHFHASCPRRHPVRSQGELPSCPAWRHAPSDPIRQRSSEREPHVVTVDLLALWARLSSGAPVLVSLWCILPLSAAFDCDRPEHVRRWVRVRGPSGPRPFGVRVVWGSAPALASRPAAREPRPRRHAPRRTWRRFAPDLVEFSTERLAITSTVTHSITRALRASRRNARS